MSSIKKLAKKLGLSRSTVYDALKGSLRVKEETRRRVEAAAKNAGLSHNPLVGALMSEVRKSNTSTFEGTIAMVDLESDKQRPARTAPFHRIVYEGANNRASQLGFRTELFVFGRDKLSVSRLDSILAARGIQGILLLPSQRVPDVSGLRWSKYAGVYADYVIDKPALDSVCLDHYRAMSVALEKLRKFGYRRPGFVLQSDADSRILFRWESAYRTFSSHIEGMDTLDPYLAEEIDELHFKRWFSKNKPDVVLSHRDLVFHWMQAMGLRVPETHGFCKMNLATTTEAMAGLDFLPYSVGEQSMDLLIGKLHRHEYGIPKVQMTSMILPVWRDGPTVTCG